MAYSIEEMEQKFDREFVTEYAGQSEKEQMIVGEIVKVEIPDAADLAKISEHD